MLEIFWGKAGMKRSQYNFSVPYPPTGETLLFNALTGAFSAIEANSYQRIEKLLAHPESKNNPISLTKYLLDQGFLIADECNEIDLIEKRNRLGIQDSNRLDVIVMPNMNCNLSCVYCYETHDQNYMSEETASRLSAWLEKLVPHYKSVLLSWFGGEPLLSYNILTNLQSFVRDLCREQDIQFSSHITTNGFALTPDKASRLIDLDLHSYQITLDGPPDVHNAMRPRNNSRGTFKQIYRNVCDLVNANDLANVKLRINYDASNIDRVSELLTLFPVALRGQINIVLERIFGEEFSNYSDNGNLSVKVESIYQMARNLGYIVTMDSLSSKRYTYCYADRLSQYVVNFNGDIFKCTVDKFKSSDRLGYLNSLGEISWEDERISDWHEVASFESKCYECKFLPMCMGGCRKVRAKEGTVGDSCKLPFGGFERRLQQRYAQERGDILEEVPEAFEVSGKNQIPVVLLNSK